MKFLAGFVLALGLCLGAYVYFGGPLPKALDRFRGAAGAKNAAPMPGAAGGAGQNGGNDKAVGSSQNGGSGQDGGGGNSDLDHRAEIAAQQRVQEFLDAPLDANSPWSAAEVTPGMKNGRQFFWVASTVKVKSAAPGGAPTRVWKAKLNYDGQQFSLAQCDIDGKRVFPAAGQPIPPDAIETDQDASRTSLQDELRNSNPGKARADELEQKRAQQKAKAALRRPETAATMLKAAKNFKASGKLDLYRKWLQKIVSDYPETEAAKEAGTLLAE